MNLDQHTLEVTTDAIWLRIGDLLTDRDRALMDGEARIAGKLDHDIACLRAAFDALVELM